MAMLQELTPDFPGEKMRGEMPSIPDRTGKNPRPLPTVFTNIYRKLVDGNFMLQKSYKAEKKKHFPSTQLKNTERKNRWLCYKN